MAREPMRKKEQKEINAEELLRSARSYFSKAFPNPERLDCPPDSDLKTMAEHPSEAAHAHVSQHLTCCSPCFNRYMEILADLKRRKSS